MKEELKSSSNLLINQVLQLLLSPDRTYAKQWNATPKGASSLLYQRSNLLKKQKRKIVMLATIGLVSLGRREKIGIQTILKGTKTFGAPFQPTFTLGCAWSLVKICNSLSTWRFGRRLGIKNYDARMYWDPQRVFAVCCLWICFMVADESLQGISVDKMSGSCHSFPCALKNNSPKPYSSIGICGEGRGREIPEPFLSCVCLRTVRCKPLCKMYFVYILFRGNS